MIYKPGNHTAPAWLDKQSSDVKKELSDPTAYGDGEFCPKLKVQLANISSDELDFVAFDGAHHGFDSSKIGHFTDPAAINKKGYIQSSSGYRDQARSQAFVFIEKI